MTAPQMTDASPSVGHATGGLPGWVVTLIAVSALAISIATLAIVLSLVSGNGPGRQMMGGAYGPGMMGGAYGPGMMGGAYGGCVTPWGP
jgi:hypothetical protein